MPVGQVTVFGGTGFLGCRIAQHLLQRGIAVRVAARHPVDADVRLRGEGKLEFVVADVRDPALVDAAVAGSDAVVNAVSLYVEHGDTTFRAIHIDGARCVAAAATRNHVQRLVQISGIGADTGARSPYVRCRGEGEMAVMNDFANATIIRPSVMFGPDDAFLTQLISLIRRLPVLPLFGRGTTRLQPVYVGDVARVVEHVLLDADAPGAVHELGGPDVVTYRELLELIAKLAQLKRMFVPVPFAIWDAIAMAAAYLPNPPLTEGQVALMKTNNVAAEPDQLDRLGIDPTPIHQIADEILRKHDA